MLNKVCVDNRLYYPSRKTPSLLSNPSPEAQQWLEEQIKAFNIGEVIEGIKPTPEENKVWFGIQVLFDQYKKEKKVEYREIFEQGRKVGFRPYITFSPSELYEACGLQKIQKAKRLDYRGGDTETTKEALYSLSMKWFLVRSYKQIGDEKRLTIRFINLYDIVSTQTENPKEIYLDKSNRPIFNPKSSNNTQIKLILNEIVSDGFDKNFVLYARDFNISKKLASKGKKCTESQDILADFFMQTIEKQKHSDNSEFAINKDELLLLLNLQKNIRRFTWVEERLEQAILFVKEMKLIESYQKMVTSDQKIEYFFLLNLDF